MDGDIKEELLKEGQPSKNDEVIYQSLEEQ